LATGHFTNWEIADHRTLANLVVPYLHHEKLSMPDDLMRVAESNFVNVIQYINVPMKSSRYSAVAHRGFSNDYNKCNDPSDVA
jgi:hypothetical protein